MKRAPWSRFFENATGVWPADWLAIAGDEVRSVGGAYFEAVFDRLVRDGQSIEVPGGPPEVASTPLVAPLRHLEVPLGVSGLSFGHLSATLGPPEADIQDVPDPRQVGAAVFGGLDSVEILVRFPLTGYVLLYDQPWISGALASVPGATTPSYVVARELPWGLHAEFRLLIQHTVGNKSILIGGEFWPEAAVPTTREAYAASVLAGKIKDCLAYRDVDRWIRADLWHAVGPALTAPISDLFDLHGDALTEVIDEMWRRPNQAHWGVAGTATWIEQHLGSTWHVDVTPSVRLVSVPGPLQALADQLSSVVLDGGAPSPLVTYLPRFQAFSPGITSVYDVLKAFVSTDGSVPLLQGQIDSMLGQGAFSPTGAVQGAINAAIAAFGLSDRWILPGTILEQRVVEVLEATVNDVETQTQLAAVMSDFFGNFEQNVIQQVREASVRVSAKLTGEGRKPDVVAEFVANPKLAAVDGALAGGGGKTLADDLAVVAAKVQPLRSSGALGATDAERDALRAVATKRLRTLLVRCALPLCVGSKRVQSGMPRHSSGSWASPVEPVLHVVDSLFLAPSEERVLLPAPEIADDVSNVSLWFSRRNIAGTALSRVRAALVGRAPRGAFDEDNAFQFDEPRRRKPHEGTTTDVVDVTYSTPFSTGVAVVPDQWDHYYLGNALRGPSGQYDVLATLTPDEWRGVRSETSELKVLRLRDIDLFWDPGGAWSGINSGPVGSVYSEFYAQGTTGRPPRLKLVISGYAEVETIVGGLWRTFEIAFFGLEVTLALHIDRSGQPSFATRVDLPDGTWAYQDELDEGLIGFYKALAIILVFPGGYIAEQVAFDKLFKIDSQVSASVTAQASDSGIVTNLTGGIVPSLGAAGTLLAVSRVTSSRKGLAVQGVIAAPDTVHRIHRHHVAFPQGSRVALDDLIQGPAFSSIAIESETHSDGGLLANFWTDERWLAFLLGERARLDSAGQGAASLIVGKWGTAPPLVAGKKLHRYSLLGQLMDLRVRPQPTSIYEQLQPLLSSLGRPTKDVHYYPNPHGGHTRWIEFYPVAETAPIADRVGHVPWDIEHLLCGAGALHGLAYVLPSASWPTRIEWMPDAFVTRDWIADVVDGWDASGPASKSWLPPVTAWYLGFSPDVAESVTLPSEFGDASAAKPTDGTPPALVGKTASGLYYSIAHLRYESRSGLPDTAAPTSSSGGARSYECLAGDVSLYPAVTETFGSLFKLTSAWFDVPEWKLPRIPKNLLWAPDGGLDGPDSYSSNGVQYGDTFAVGYWPRYFEVSVDLGSVTGLVAPPFWEFRYWIEGLPGIWSGFWGTGDANYGAADELPGGGSYIDQGYAQIGTRLLHIGVCVRGGDPKSNRPGSIPTLRVGLHPLPNPPLGRLGLGDRTRTFRVWCELYSALQPRSIQTPLVSSVIVVQESPTAKIVLSGGPGYAGDWPYSKPMPQYVPPPPKPM